MARTLRLVGAFGLCAVALAVQPALGAGDRLLCAGDGATAAILVPGPARAAGDREPLISLDGTIAPAAAGTALQGWAGDRFATARNAQVLDTFFKARTGGGALAVTAVDGYLVYHPIAGGAAAGDALERQVSDRLRAMAARDLPLRPCLTLKLPLWSSAPVALDRSAPTRFRDLMGRVGDAPVARVAEARWIEQLHAGGARHVATSESALEASGGGDAQ